MRCRRHDGAFRVKAGFTLIELLVVISIIALLIAMLLPALSTAKETAKSIKCATQARQLSMAADAYADAERDFYPPRAAPEWPKVLQVYGLVEEMLVCPTDFEPVPTDLPRSYFFNGFNDAWSVAVNGGTLATTAGNWAMPRRAIKLPSEVVLFGEKETDSGHFYMDMYEGVGNDFTELALRRHIDGSNYAFADAHAVALPAPDALAPVNLWGVNQLGRESVFVE